MKQKWTQKRFFNMIEVCLALGVMAVGVVGAVAILPSAMKTSQIASNDVYIADAVNIVFSQIDREANRIQFQYNEEYREISDQYDEKIENETNAERQQELQEEKINELKKFSEEDIYTDYENLFKSSANQGQDNVCEATLWNALPDGMIFTSGVSGANTDGAEIRMYFKKNPGARLGVISLYQVHDNGTISDAGAPDSYSSAAKTAQSGVQPFFRAMVRIYSTPIVYDPEAGNDDDKSDAIRRIERKDPEWRVVNYEVDGKPMKGLFKLESTEPLTIDHSDRRKAHWRRIYVEFSYPVNVPIARRTKKTFVKEYYLMD